MKNIEAIMTELNIQLTDDQLKNLKTQVAENYKPIADYQKQKEKVDTLETTLKETKENLAKFDGADIDAMKKQIADLQSDIKAKEDDLKKKDTEYAQQIADRDFSDLIDRAIAAKGGKNAKAIKALMDMEALKASKNQQADVDAAIDALTKAEDSAMLFGANDPKKVRSGNPIGAVRKDNNQGETTTLASALADYYSK